MSLGKILFLESALYTGLTFHTVWNDFWPLPSRFSSFHGWGRSAGAGVCSGNANLSQQWLSLSGVRQDWVLLGKPTGGPLLGEGWGWRWWWLASLACWEPLSCPGTPGGKAMGQSSISLKGQAGGRGAWFYFYPLANEPLTLITTVHVFNMPRKLLGALHNLQTTTTKQLQITNGYIMGAGPWDAGWVPIPTPSQGLHLHQIVYMLLMLKSDKMGFGFL